MTVKDIYLSAHAAAVTIDGQPLNPPKLRQAVLDAFEKTDFDPIDFDSFEAHFLEVRNKLRHLDGIALPSDMATAETKRIEANKAKLLAKKSGAPAPAPAPAAPKPAEPVKEATPAA